MKLSTPRSVFVPFEWTGKAWEKRDDLPRFTDPSECSAYITAHPEISYRKDRFVHLEWREHTERDLIAEYVAGVGTPRFNQQKH